MGSWFLTLVTDWTQHWMMLRWTCSRLSLLHVQWRQKDEVTVSESQHTSVTRRAKITNTQACSPPPPPTHTHTHYRLQETFVMFLKFKHTCAQNFIAAPFMRASDVFKPQAEFSTTISSLWILGTATCRWPKVTVKTHFPGWKKKL